MRTLIVEVSIDAAGLKGIMPVPRPAMADAPTTINIKTAAGKGGGKNGRGESMNVVRIEDIQDVIVALRDQSVIIDCDVAEIYGVETKRINEAVKNNPDKFPSDYMFELTNQEFDVLRSKFSTANFAKTRTTPKAFTEKGLYMIATILTGKKAMEATCGIIETFAKIRELSRTVKALSVVKDDSEQKKLMQ